MAAAEPSGLRRRQWVRPPGKGGVVILVSADEVYLRRYLGGVLVSALLAGMRLHVNCISPSKDTAAMLDTLAIRFRGLVSFSTEEPTLPDAEARPYFAASRFCCARELIQQYGCAVHMVDIDSIVMRPLEIPAADYGLFLRSSDNAKFSVAAGAVFVAPGGLRFLETFEDLFFAARPWAWFDDQICLKQAHDSMRDGGLRAVRLSSRFLGFNYHPEIAVWSAKGDAKTADRDFVGVLDLLAAKLQQVL